MPHLKLIGYCRTCKWWDRDFAPYTKQLWTSEKGKLQSKVVLTVDCKKGIEAPSHGTWGCRHYKILLTKET